MSLITSHFIPLYWYSCEYRNIERSSILPSIHCPFFFTTLSCPHTSHLCIITYMFAYTLEFPQNWPCPLLENLLAPLSSAGLPSSAWCSNSILPLLFERMSHLTSSLSVLASVLFPIVGFTCVFPYGVHPTDSTSLKGTSFFSLKQGQLFSVHHYRHILDANF